MRTLPDADGVEAFTERTASADFAHLVVAFAGA
jgi:hypothetical protein